MKREGATIKATRLAAQEKTFFATGASGVAIAGPDTIFTSKPKPEPFTIEIGKGIVSAVRAFRIK
ncbi:MAG: hypothetical protein ACYCUI_11185 [Vulcanimicrobiaceae bacterium]